MRQSRGRTGQDSFGAVPGILPPSPSSAVWVWVEGRAIIAGGSARISDGADGSMAYYYYSQAHSTARTQLTRCGCDEQILPCLAGPLRECSSSSSSRARACVYGSGKVPEPLTRAGVTRALLASGPACVPFYSTVLKRRKGRLGSPSELRAHRAASIRSAED